MTADRAVGLALIVIAVVWLVRDLAHAARTPDRRRVDPQPANRLVFGLDDGLTDYIAAAEQALDIANERDLDLWELEMAEWIGRQA